MRSFLRRFDGPQTLGRGRAFWIGFAAVVAVSVAFPIAFDGFVVNNVGYFLVWAFMALGLSLMWGYAGILSFGQTAFFGLSGYAYGVVTLNFGDAPAVTWAALALAVALSAGLAAVVGYFMFYGGITDVFIGIVTLSITLVFEAFMAQTAGPEWAIGKARLNGFNGMSNMPSLTLPTPSGNLPVDGTVLYCVLLACLIAAYLGLRWLVNSRFGNVLVAIRENPVRAEMLGYDVRRYQLAAFVIGSALAGVSGVFYTTWGSYITPSAMGLTASAAPIVWVATGGRKDLTATLVSTLAFIWISQSLAVYGSQYALILQGAVLLAAVLLAPEGFVVSIARRWSPSARRARTGKAPEPPARVGEA
jgi:urea transport system permease protein